MKDDLKPTHEMKYEEAFQELKDLVNKLESSELPLEEGLALLERGQALSARCRELLEEAELKLKQLVPDDSGEYVEKELE
jgi:exodeoxyribonuclease VII small subunit